MAKRKPLTAIQFLDTADNTNGVIMSVGKGNEALLKSEESKTIITNYLSSLFPEESEETIEEMFEAIVNTSFEDDTEVILEHNDYEIYYATINYIE